MLWSLSINQALPVENSGFAKCSR